MLYFCSLYFLFCLFLFLSVIQLVFDSLVSVTNSIYHCNRRHHYCNSLLFKYTMFNIIIIVVQPSGYMIIAFHLQNVCRNVYTLHYQLKINIPYFMILTLLLLWSAVAQLVECRTRNRESPGSNPRCYRFEVWAFSFTSRRLSRLSCINEYLAIDSGGNVSE